MKNEINNLGFILKQSVIDACGTMSDSEFRETITGLFNYATKGIEPEFSAPLSKVVFTMEKPSIDYNNQKWYIKRKEFFKKSYQQQQEEEDDFLKEMNEIGTNKKNGNFVGKYAELIK